MKVSRLGLLFLIFCNSCIGQKGTIIQGKIDKPHRPYLVLHYYDEYWLKEYKDTIQIRKDNTFKHKLLLTTPFKPCQLMIDDKRSIDLMLYNKINVNLGAVDSVGNFKTNGELSRILEYLRMVNKKWFTIQKEYERKNPKYMKDNAFYFTDQYFEIQDSVAIDRIEYLKNYFYKTPNGYEKTFINHEKNKIINSFLSERTNRIKNFEVYQNTYNIKDQKAYKFTNIDFDKASLLSNELFLNFARNFFIKDALLTRKKGVDYSPKEITQSLFNSVDKFSKNKFCNSIYKAFILNAGIVYYLREYKTSANAEHINKELINTLRANSTINKQLDLVEANLATKLSEIFSLKPGQPVPNFSFSTANGDTIKLNDYKGKVLYIDVWASWCGPCINNIEDWNKLVTKYESNKNIAFLMISLDKDRENWLSAISRFKPLGIHLIAQDEFEGIFAKAFGIKGIPRQILINKDCQLIDLSADDPGRINLEKHL